MQTTVELTEKDIIQTIANTFNVNICRVTLKYDEVWVGYGQNEHKECKVSAKVIMENRDN